MRDFNDINIFNAYLLCEKDHRSKMIKFGIPEDVANYLHELDDKRSIWIANQIKTMDEYKQSPSKISWIKNRIEPEYREILDWVSNAPNILLKQYTWDEALEASRQWHNSLDGKTIEGQEENNIIKKYDNGYYWVDLESSRCKDEGELMGHCGSTEADTIFSLRSYDPKTNTIDGHVSVAISPDDGIWRQAKGKRNSKPKPEYFQYIVDILIEYDTYGYKAEYAGEADFRDTDFIQYIKENPKQFKDPESLITKIEESSPNLYKEIKDLLSRYSFDKFLVDIEDYSDYYDESDMVGMQAYLPIEQKLSIKLNEDRVEDDDISEKFIIGIYDELGLSPPESIDSYNDMIDYDSKNDTLKISIDAHVTAMDLYDAERFIDEIQYADVKASRMNILDNLKSNGMIESYFFDMYKHFQETNEGEEFDNLPEMEFLKPFVSDDLEDSLDFQGEIEIFDISIPKDSLIENLIKYPQSITPESKTFYEITKERNHPFYYIYQIFIKSGILNRIRIKNDTRSNTLFITFTDTIPYDPDNDDKESYKEEYMHIKKKDSILSEEQERFKQFFEIFVKPKIKTARELPDGEYEYDTIPQFESYYKEFEDKVKREMAEPQKEDERQMKLSFKDFYNND